MPQGKPRAKRPKKAGLVPPHGFDLSRREAARYVGSSEATLADWAYKRINLPYVVAGGVAWYRRSDCDHLLAKRERKVSNAA